MASSSDDQEATLKKWDKFQRHGLWKSRTDIVTLGKIEYTDKFPSKSQAIPRYAVKSDDVANPIQVKTCHWKVHRSEKYGQETSQNNSIAISGRVREFLVSFEGIPSASHFDLQAKAKDNTYAKQMYKVQMRKLVRDDRMASVTLQSSNAETRSQKSPFRCVSEDAIGKTVTFSTTICNKVYDCLLSSGNSNYSMVSGIGTMTTAEAAGLATTAVRCVSAIVLPEAYKDLPSFRKPNATTRCRGSHATTAFFVTLVMLLFRTFPICHAKEQLLPEDSCGLYLAPSTIPGAGLGIFAGHFPYKEGDKIGDPDIMIPVYELDWHNGDDKFDFLWDEYTWSTKNFPGMEDDIEEALDQSHIISSGFGAAVNCMIPLVNVQDYEGPGGYQMTTSGVTSQSPGAGAFTPMTGRSFEAMKNIEPFAELYADYGSKYFEARAHYRSIPLKDDFEPADQLVWKYFKLFEERLQNDNETNDDGFVEKVKNVSGLEQDLWGLIIDTRQVWQESRILHALPGKNTSLNDLEGLMGFGGTKMLHYNISIKTKEWMDEFGQCMDNIRDGISRIPHAGRGAFARRFIAEGGLVSPAPLVHLPNRSSLITYLQFITEKGQWRRNVSAPIHHQLLLNYCFGHSQSSLLLCPYGMLNFLINHDSIDPNTKIQWSKNQRHPEWFDLPVEKWGNTMHNGLSMDFVALRDIQPGEEITIDYGPEWEEAWLEHVRTFDVPRPHYTPAFELNKLVDLTIPTLWNDDGLPSLESVLTFCRSFFLPPDFHIDPYRYGFAGDDDHGEYFLCRVLNRNATSNTYTAEVLKRESWRANKLQDIYETVVDTPLIVLFDLPRDAFFFRDVHYGRDHHQSWSFRHDMRIPEDMFPELWKNSP